MNFFGKSASRSPQSMIDEFSAALEATSREGIKYHAMSCVTGAIATVATRMGAGVLVEGDVDRLAALTAALAVMEGQE